MDKFKNSILKGSDRIADMGRKIYGIMQEFNCYDVEETDHTEVEETLIYDPYAIIDSLTEIIDRLSTDLNIEREKVDFAISEATKKLNSDNRIVCDSKTMFCCVVNGKELSYEELCDIGQYFKSCEFGENIRNYYKKGISDEEAFILGDKVNYYLVREDEISEKQAIEKVLNAERIERIKQIHNTLADMYGELFNIASPSEIESELKFVQDAIKNTTKGE